MAGHEWMRAGSGRHLAELWRPRGVRVGSIAALFLASVLSVDCRHPDLLSAQAPHPARDERVGAKGGLANESRPPGRVLYAITDLMDRTSIPWLLDEFGMHRGEDVQIKGEVLSEHLFRVTISEFEISNGDTIVLDLHNEPEAHPSADVTVLWISDCGPGVPWENIEGWVHLSSGSWSKAGSASTEPLVVEFWLHGTSEGEKCAHGVAKVLN
jgi:hypothetical protein